MVVGVFLHLHKLRFQNPGLEASGWHPVPPWRARGAALSAPAVSSSSARSSHGVVQGSSPWHENETGISPPSPTSKQQLQAATVRGRCEQGLLKPCDDGL